RGQGPCSEAVGLPPFSQVSAPMTRASSWSGGPCGVDADAMESVKRGIPDFLGISRFFFCLPPWIRGRFRHGIRALQAAVDRPPSVAGPLSWGKRLKIREVGAAPKGNEHT